MPFWAGARGSDTQELDFMPAAAMWADHWPRATRQPTSRGQLAPVWQTDTAGDEQRHASVVFVVFVHFVKHHKRRRWKMSFLRCAQHCVHYTCGWAEGGARTPATLPPNPSSCRLHHREQPSCRTQSEANDGLGTSPTESLAPLAPLVNCSRVKTLLWILLNFFFQHFRKKELNKPNKPNN